ncbi:hypothetical protein ACFPVX_02115 [Cohnella faecalis]|uniref:Uncharacterized protein n=1 Tax=Cohnella faecalis TaxID=2315694 RepID=A0A398CYB3_9BACL|nr:hypothetical protein [Cohnella faecalis]RIE04797.1 hypothetical protein D3H35_04830 [Cohnella faecalis]
MIRYADEKWDELRFVNFRPEVDKRDGQWIDVALEVETDSNTPLPEDIIEFSIVIVCTHKGHPIQAVTLEQGCDSEYQLTAAEKEQIFAYIATEEMQRAIVAAAGEDVK